MRTSTPLLDPEPIRLSASQRDDLKRWVEEEITNTLSSRRGLEQQWAEAFRLYEAKPKEQTRDFPYLNSPNIVIPLAGIAVETIYAQVIDLIFTVNPIITVQPLDSRYTEAAKALQRFTNWIVANETDLRPAAEQSILDDVQLGTGVYYIPWAVESRKTKLVRVVQQSPRIFPIAPEDFLTCSGSSDLQSARWVAMRSYYTYDELQERAKDKEVAWNIDEVSPAGAVEFVRLRRERLGHTSQPIARAGDLYEIFEVYCYYDIDDDGIREDLILTLDWTSKSILRVDYSPYDRRPFSAFRYQIRSHLFYGLGVPEMIRNFQEEATETHNSRMANMHIANTRCWVARHGSIPDSTDIYPGKVIQVQDPDDLRPLPMGEIYPSSTAAEAITISLAERRVGVGEINNPGRALGNRTPGITALSMLQQVNRRFSPAFDAVRIATGEAVKQCLYRYQEALLAERDGVSEHIQKVLGAIDANLVITLLKDTSFDDAVSVELTTSSAQVNRDMDRQNGIMLMQMLQNYYRSIIELSQLASSPQVPPATREIAVKVSHAAGEALERILRTFDSTRDPATFIVELTNELDQEPQQDTGMGGLPQLLAQLSGAGQPALPEGGEGAQLQ